MQRTQERGTRCVADAGKIKSLGHPPRKGQHIHVIRLESSTTHAIDSAAAYAPFGEPYAQSGSYGELSFTGANKDTLWLDYDFLYREYDPKQGRWISPDPAGLSAVDPTNPQSWNRYAYVLNNPMAIVDPSGEDGCNFSGAEIPNLSNMSFNCELDAAEAAYSGWVDAMFNLGNATVGGVPYTIDWSIGGSVFWVNTLTGDALTNKGAEEIGLPGFDGAPSVVAANNGQQQPQQSPKTPQQPQQPQQPKPILSPGKCLAWSGFNIWFNGFNMGVTVASDGAGAPLFLISIPSMVLQNAICSAGGATHP